MPPLRAILLFGAPGTGKGTQGKILAQVPGLHHVATGDLFRALDKSSPLGQKFLHYSTRGELVPDDLTIELFLTSLSQREGNGAYRPARDLLVLDGIPRSVGQARALAPHLAVLGIIHLTCRDEDAMVARMRRRALKENRPDDADEAVIRRRFEVYRAESAPVLGEYPKGIVHDVDAVGSPAAVLGKVLASVAPIIDEHFGNALG